jgi:hypothetical protein
MGSMSGVIPVKKAFIHHLHMSALSRRMDTSGRASSRHVGDDTPSKTWKISSTPKGGTREGSAHARHSDSAEYPIEGVDEEVADLY